MAVSDWFLTAEERANPATSVDSGKPDGVAWWPGSRVRLIVHGRPYMAELFERLSAMGEGDRVWFVDWRGDPDQRLTDDPASGLSDTLVAACRRGVDVRGLLWRSHWRHFGYHANKARYLGEDIEEAGGQCLRDMRVRTGGSHHQKFVVLQHADDPAKDVAYVGGIDLCHSRRDDEEHRGDPQPLELAAEYGPTPAWHDVQVAIEGPAVADVARTFRERWEDSVPLTLNPGRLAASLLQREDLLPRDLGPVAPPPPAPDGAREVVQILRTFPRISPVGFDFAPDGEVSVALGNAKAMSRARRLIYVEDQYLWSTEIGERFAQALRASPDLHLVVVLPFVPDEDGALARAAQLHGRSLALREILSTAPDRVGVFGLTNEVGLPVYVHAKACVIDDQWASVGSDNLNRRSWTYDSEISCTVQDADGADGAPSPTGFPAVMRRTLAAEHLGCRPEDVPDDSRAFLEAFRSGAAALDAWYAAGPDARRGPRPPGRLRALDIPELTGWVALVAPRVYGLAYDPDGTNDEEKGRITSMTRRGPLRRLHRPALRPRLYGR